MAPRTAENDDNTAHNYTADIEPWSEEQVLRRTRSFSVRRKLSDREFKLLTEFQRLEYEAYAK